MPLLRRVKRGSKLKFGKKRRRRKQPVTYRLGSMIRAHYDLDPRTVQAADHYLTTLICILLIGITGMFRLGELLPARLKILNPLTVIRRGQIKFFENQDFGCAGTTPVARIWLFKSKGDPFSEGTPVFVPANPTDPLNCPVQWLKATLRLCPTDTPNASTPVFTHPKGRLLLKQTFTNWLKRSLSTLGFNPKLYAGHSLRIGGAVSAHRAGVPEHIIQTMGRWRGDSYRLYIRYEPSDVSNLRDHLNRLSSIHTDKQA